MTGDNQLNIIVLADQLLPDINTVIGGGNGGVAGGRTVKASVSGKIVVGGDDNSAVGVSLDDVLSPGENSVRGVPVESEE